jgi:hypothetical protein
MAERPTIMEELAAVFRDERLGAATKLAFLYLWTAAGRRPGELVVSLTHLGAAYGRTRRAAHKWIGQLAEIGLVQVDDHDERAGKVYLTVWHPSPGKRERRPDPQQRLPLSYDRPPEPPPRDVSAPQRPADPPARDLLARKRPAGPERRDVSAPKRPATPGETEGTPHAPARAVDVDKDEDESIRSTSTDDQREEPGTEDDQDADATWRRAVEAAYRHLDKYPVFQAGIRRDDRNRSLWLKAHYLAYAELGEAWLSDSLEATAAMLRAHRGNPWAYLHRCLANRAMGEDAPGFDAGQAARQFNHRLARVTLTLADQIIRLRRHIEAL